MTQQTIARTGDNANPERLAREVIAAWRQGKGPGQVLGTPDELDCTLQEALCLPRHQLHREIASIPLHLKPPR